MSFYSYSKYRAVYLPIKPFTTKRKRNFSSRFFKISLVIIYEENLLRLFYLLAWKDVFSILNYTAFK